MSDDMKLCGVIACAIASILGLTAFGLYAHWVRAGAQARAYQRQGVDITQEEVFMGAEPIERIVRLKEEK